MKEFLMKFNEKGKPTFFDESDRAPYRALLSSIKKSSNIFVMTIDVYQKRTTKEQKKLFHVLVDLISMETGNDVQTIEETLLNNFSKIKTSLEEMTNEIFNNFLNWTIVFCNEFFGINITMNQQGNFEIKKI